ncbi:MAG: hypothetical protein ABUK01_14720 [Leptospirales bacterium]
MKKCIFLLFVVFLLNCSNATGQFDNVPSGVTVVAGNNQFTILSGMIALEEVEIEENANINSNVYVIGGCSLHDEDNTEEENDVPELHCSKIEIDENVNVGTGYILKAEKIKVKKNAIIDGNLEANVFEISPEAIIKHGTNPLGDLPGYPDFLIGTIGSTDVSAADSPLAEGNYKKLEISKDDTLELDNGWYTFESIELEKSSSLTCLHTCVVMVKGSIKLKKETKLITATGNPNDLTFFVSSEHKTEKDDEDEDEDEEDENIKHDDNIEINIGKDSLVIANIYAKNAELEFGKDSNVLGSFIARKIKVGKNTTVSAGFILTKDTIYAGTVDGEQVVVDMKRNGNYEMMTSAEPGVTVQGHYYLTPDKKIMHFEWENALCTTCGNISIPDSAFTNIPFKELEIKSFSEDEIIVSPVTDSILPSPSVTFSKTNSFVIDTATGYTKMNITVTYPDASRNGKYGILSLRPLISDNFNRGFFSVEKIENATATFTVQIAYKHLPGGVPGGKKDYRIYLFISNDLSKIHINADLNGAICGNLELGQNEFNLTVPVSDKILLANVDFVPISNY